MLYTQRSLDVDRWEASDREVGQRLASLEKDPATLPNGTDPERMQRAHERLLAIRDTFEEIIPIDPSQARRILVAAGETIRRTPDGLRIDWPVDLAVFFDHR